MADQLNTGEIREWRSIVTLIVFVATNIIVLYPFHIPLWIPRPVGTAVSKAMVALRIVPPKKELDLESKLWVRSRLPINLVTAPLIAVLFLLAIGAIGREEVRDGTLGADDIHPLDIMVFFITLAYIAVSIDTSGLIRFLAYKVLQKAGANGRRLFFYLYVFFFALATCVGNDPIVLSGTPFLAYMTRITQNIENPRAWIYMQFAVANIASAILVSSNPTNLVLAGAFNIKFIDYTANMIVPVLVTAIALFPLLLYVIFRQEKLIPGAIKMHELPEEIKNKEPICPNVPYAKGNAESADDGQRELALLEEILNPYLDKRGAAFGFIIMAATLITILVLNAVQGGHTNPVFWITLPAAVVVFSWDVAFGWYNRHDTREIARIGREKVDNACASQESGRPRATGEKTPPDRVVSDSSDNALVTTSKHTTFVSFMANSWSWARETFPTATTVLKLLPFALVPFAFCMFILVQALVTKGWVPVFAHGWNNWIRATGTLGAIGGMAFVSVILCNFAGTNIGTTILICRVLQAWLQIRQTSGAAVSDRTFWAAVYSMALGVNYGAFSTAFSASLAGLLWRDILGRKHIHVRSRDFARYNLPIIISTMIVGCAVLAGEVYIMRGNEPYQGGL